MYRDRGTRVLERRRWIKEIEVDTREKLKSRMRSLRSAGYAPVAVSIPCDGCWWFVARRTIFLAFIVLLVEIIVQCSVVWNGVVEMMCEW